MGCNKNLANITTTTGLGSIDSPYFVQVHIAQRLCAPVCVDNVPIFNPTFSVVSYEAIGTGEYVATIKVEGIIYYNPCGGNTCATRMVSQTFPLPFASTTAPTSVTISAGVAVNSLSAVGCNNYSREFVSDVPINLTVA